MKKSLTFFLLAVVVVGCSRKIAPTSTTITKDSVYVREITRRDTVKLPGQKITVTKFIHCDSASHRVMPFEVKEKKNQATIDVVVKADGTLTATASCDSLNKIIESKDKEIEHYRTTTKTETTIIKEHEPYWFDIAARWIAGVTLLAGGIYFYIKTQTKLL